MSSEFSDHSEIPDDLKHVEQSLAAMSPRPPQVDRDRLMFLAGAAAAGNQGPGASGQTPLMVAQRSSWLWPAATAALGATSLALAVALVVRTSAPPQIVYVDRPAPPIVQAAATPGPVQESTAPAEQIAAAPAARVQRNELPQIPVNNYVRARDVALRMGLDALGGPRSSGGGTTAAMTYFDWLAEQRAPAADADQPGDEPVADVLPRM